MAVKTKPKPKLITTYVRLDPKHIAKLDQLARKMQCDRSVVIRQFIAKGLEDVEK